MVGDKMVVGWEGWVVITCVGVGPQGPGAAGSSQEQPGATRSSQEQPGTARSSQEQPGAPRAARSSQEHRRRSHVCR